MLWVARTKVNAGKMGVVAQTPVRAIIGRGVLTFSARVANNLLCRRPNILPGLVDVAPFFFDFHVRQPVGEGVGLIVLKRDYHLSVFVDVAPFPAVLYFSQPFGESPGVGKLWRDDHLSRLVDVPPLPVDLYGCQPFGE